MSNTPSSSCVVTKQDLTVQLQDQTGLTQSQITDVLELFMDIVTAHLAAGSEVVMRNFGTFRVRTAKAKVGRNPRRPEREVRIPERTVVKFSSGKELKERVGRLVKR